MAHILISYSHYDKEYAHRLAKDLIDQGLSVWIDDRIDYGTRWLHEIEAHIDDCSAFIVIMTPSSKESDWVQNEWLYARDKKKPIYALLLDGDAWLAFRSTQYADVRGSKLPPADFYERLKAIIPKAALPAAPAPEAYVQTWGGVEFVRIPAGKFLMGSNDNDKLAYDDERPQRTVEIPSDYWMARYPVTNEQFARFVQEAAYTYGLAKDWTTKAKHPVVKVSWRDAIAYCKWLHSLIAHDIGTLNTQVRLPTEAEWEKAARSVNGNEWPWGDDFDKDKCNSGEGKKGGTTAVGAYSPQGDSPYHVADMAGNVLEWCHSLFKPYPYAAGDGREDELDEGERMLRGGSFSNNQRLVRSAYRGYNLPDDRYDDYGFRVVVSPGL